METYKLIRFNDRNIIELIFMFVCLASIPFTIIALFIVLRKSPPQMKAYKWIIINFTLTTFFTDIIICFLYDPIPLFPHVACYSKSWLANVDENANYVLLVSPLS
ncbi:unnamed protein product [Cylicostephanus goldi]|uniref:Uncharacterized protein n=1 Tax=Cylicostephanus goldi TaxID=71465 RepID=A0A3P6RDR1_CYLGO|nr:unnamed protein product [Cylicostephanus goldi]